jgi:hypothetical protein
MLSLTAPSQEQGNVTCQYLKQNINSHTLWHRIAAGSKLNNKSRKATVIDITDTDEESESSHKDVEAPKDAAEDSEVELSQ